MENLSRKQRILLFLFIFVVFLFILLPSLSHKNPLLEDRYINNIKENAMFVDDSPSFEKCLKFYRDKIKDRDLEKKCDSWILEYRKQLISTDNIPPSTKIDDLKSPKLWERVRPVKY